MTSLTIDTPAEYALYWLAINRPDILREADSAKRHGIMANDQTAAALVKSMLRDALTLTPAQVADVADALPHHATAAWQAVRPLQERVAHGGW